MPTIAELQDPAVTDDMLLKNKDIVQQMEDLVMSWEKHIQKVSDLILLSLRFSCFLFFLSFSFYLRRNDLPWFLRDSLLLATQLRRVLKLSICK